MSEQLEIFTQEEFSIPKVSVLNTLSGKWKARKRWWTETYNIQSELGRDLSNGNRGLFDIGENGTTKMVSIFDPVLCEVMYKWFAVPSGSVLDPFAGGSVRGIVAKELGYKYTGIELLEAQVKANQEQSTKPIWIQGDSDVILSQLDTQYQMLFSCPPYHDLEVYSDKEEDLSTLEWEAFLEKYRSIIAKSYDRLEDNSFAVFVVSELREYNTKGKYTEGYYKGFVPETIKAFEDAGFRFYNDLILQNSIHSAVKVSETYFTKNRKIPSTHQNILVFIKGNPDLATIKITKERGTVCFVDGQSFNSYREAGIHLGLPASEVERRCKSNRITYHSYSIEGKDNYPEYKISIGGFLFESYVDAKRFIPLTEQEIRSRVLSPQRQYRHYILLDEPVVDKSYEENEKDLLSVDISLELPTISCEGKEYFSIKEAATALGVSGERVRQKLKQDRFTDYFYL